MKKFLKKFLCILLIAAMPLNFSACKNKNVSQTPSNNEQSNNSGDNNPPEYVVDGDEVNRIINLSSTKFSDFIDDLNESNILKNNSYDSEMGNQTYTILNCIYYPNVFVGKKTGTVSLDHFYIFNNSGIEDYFKISSKESNDGFFIEYITSDNRLFKYVKYDFQVNNGNLIAIDLSYYETGVSSSYTDFSVGKFDFINKEFEIKSARIISNFSGGSFDSIDSGDWSYSLYEKVNFSENSSFVSQYQNSGCLTKIETDFSDFVFVNASNKLKDMRNSKNSEGTNYTVLFTDIFAVAENYVVSNMLEYDSINCVFEK